MSDSYNCHTCGARGDARCVCVSRIVKCKGCGDNVNVGAGEVHACALGPMVGTPRDVFEDTSCPSCAALSFDRCECRTLGPTEYSGRAKPGEVHGMAPYLPERKHRVWSGRKIVQCMPSVTAVGADGIEAEHVQREGRLALDWHLVLYSEYDGHDIRIGISFCPWCGERLPEHPEEGNPP